LPRSTLFPYTTLFRSVTGDLEVLPDVVRDRRADVPLQVRVVRDPAARPRVEVLDRRLLAPVAAALPRVHRSAIAGPSRGSPGCVEPAVPVHEQRARDVGHAHVEQREDEEL